MAAVNQEAPSDKSSAIAREAAAEPLEDGWQEEEEEEEEEERLRWERRVAGVTHSLPARQKKRAVMQPRLYLQSEAIKNHLVDIFPKKYFLLMERLFWTPVSQRSVDYGLWR